MLKTINLLRKHISHFKLNKIVFLIDRNVLNPYYALQLYAPLDRKQKYAKVKK